MEFFTSALILSAYQFSLVWSCIPTQQGVVTTKTTTTSTTTTTTTTTPAPVCATCSPITIVNAGAYDAPFTTNPVAGTAGCTLDYVCQLNPINAAGPVAITLYYGGSTVGPSNAYGTLTVTAICNSGTWEVSGGSVDSMSCSAS